MFIHSGAMFSDWQGDLVVAGGVASQLLLRFDIEAGEARLIERFDMARPLIDVEQAPDGSIWLLEEALPVTRARIVKLTPCGKPASRP
jgi:hypothetical protein